MKNLFESFVELNIINKIFYSIIAIINIITWLLYLYFNQLSDIHDFEGAMFDKFFFEIKILVIFLVSNLIIIISDKNNDYRLKRKILFFVNLPCLIFFSFSLISPLNYLISGAIDCLGIQYQYEWQLILPSIVIHIFFWWLLLLMVVWRRKINDDIA